MENTKEIGDRTYVFSMLPPEEAIDVEVAVARVIGEPLFKAFMSTGDGQSDADSQAAAGAAAVGLLVSKMNAADLKATMKTVFKYTGYGANGDSKGKTTLTLNDDFKGRNKEVWLVFVAALQFNFSDFLPAKLLSSVKGLAEK